jgi:hypothetical protein
MALYRTKPEEIQVIDAVRVGDSYIYAHPTTGESVKMDSAVFDSRFEAVPKRTRAKKSAEDSTAPTDTLTTL